MPREIRAIVSDGKLEPLEDLNLPDGEEVVVLIMEHSKPKKGEAARIAFERSAGGWDGLVDTDDLLRIIRERRKIVSPPVEL